MEGPTPTWNRPQLHVSCLSTNHTWIAFPLRHKPLCDRQGIPPHTGSIAPVLVDHTPLPQIYYYIIIIILFIIYINNKKHNINMNTY